MRNKLLYPIHEYSESMSDIVSINHNLGTGNGMYNDEDLHANHDYGDGSYSLMQEATSTTSSNQVVRGGTGVSSMFWTSYSIAPSHHGWRPVLELVKPADQDDSG